MTGAQSTDDYGHNRVSKAEQEILKAYNDKDFCNETTAKGFGVMESLYYLVRNVKPIDTEWSMRFDKQPNYEDGLGNFGNGMEEVLYESLLDPVVDKELYQAFDGAKKESMARGEPRPDCSGSSGIVVCGGVVGGNAADSTFISRGDLSPSVCDSLVKASQKALTGSGPN